MIIVQRVIAECMEYSVSIQTLTALCNIRLFDIKYKVTTELILLTLDDNQILLTLLIITINYFKNIEAVSSVLVDLISCFFVLSTDNQITV